ncbi:hypothetical protein [Nocardia transvalensis]|uniref:restriction endonuclease subunit S n=1 Tax=Nocardia transvalensis TaxID=37333 RepID=UPI0018948B5C|nr:hypothetical protein [Nocardia transvalensis]MBF6333304.1 hypothetical protein [Nocardia transvalensis]
MLERSDWQRVRFGDVVRQVKATIEPDKTELRRYVAGEHMDTDRLHLKRWGSVDDGYLGPAFHRHFRPGQVLYGSRRTYLRKVAFADFEGVCANTTFVAEPQDPELLIPRFLPLIMSAEPFHRHSVSQSKGSVNPYVNWSDLAWYEFDLPPVHVQERIADLVWDAETVIEANRHVTKQARQTEIATLRDTYDTSSWPRRKVSEVGDVQLGLKREPKVHSGAHPRPYLRVANVGDDELFLNDVLSMNFKEKDFERYRLRSGDILLNEGQSLELVGRCTMYRDEIPGCCFQMTLLRFRCGPEVLPEFAYGWFRRCFYLGMFSRVAARTTSMAHLTARIFSGLDIPVPTLDVQREVVERIEAARILRRRLEGHENVTRQLRPQLLNYLLAERP